MADAQNSGNCTVITNAVVAHVNMDIVSNKANGVTYVDRMTREVKEVRGKAVTLCAQALESTCAQLLNSLTTDACERALKLRAGRRDTIDGTDVTGGGGRGRARGHEP